MEEKNFVTFRRLSLFLTYLKTIFAGLSHKHTISDLTDYTVDTQLSSTSSNTVQNKVVNAAIESIKTQADANLASAKSYADSAVDTKVGAHNTSTSAHSDIRVLITNLTTRLNALADSDDTTLDQMSEIVEYIKSNRTLIDSVTTNKINVSDIIDNLTTNSSTKVLAASQGVAIKALIDALQAEVDSHTHTISDVTGLQTALDGKAASSHGTHVSYSTTAPVMDGTASAGTATTVARSDHKHPVDTSRASQADLTALTNTVSGKADASHTHDGRYYTETEIDTKINTLTTSVDNKQATITGAATTITGSDLTKSRALVSNASGKVAVSDVTATELGYLDGVTSNIQTQFNEVSTKYETKTDSEAKLDAAKAYADTVASGKAAVSHTHDERYYTEAEIDTKIDNINTSISGKAASAHSHAVSDVTGLQTSLDDIDEKLGDTIKSMAVSGTKITYTRTDGTTGSITTQDTNTDTKVTTTLNSTAKAYVTGTTTGTTSTGGLVFDTGVYLDTTSGTIVATSFKGKATSAASADTATSSTKATQDGSGNVITSTYETKTDASSKLSEVKTYADKAAVDAANAVKDELLNGAGAAYDTLKELGELIDTNTTAIDALEEVAAGKMDKVNPTGSGNVSFGRASGSTVGDNSVAIGDSAKATAKNSVAIGSSTTASGENSTVIGCGATASGIKSVALGDHNVASGEYATAIGCWTKAPGTAAIALGNGTIANGWGAMASGIVTEAKGLGQHVFGSYNIPDSNTISDYGDVSDHIIIVGNGDVVSDDGVQSNAMTLDWDGNAWFSGDVYVGSSSGTNKDSGSVRLVSEDDLNSFTMTGTRVSFDNSGTDLTSATVQAAIKELTALQYASYIYYDDSNSLMDSGDIMSVQDAIYTLATRHSTETWTFELEDGTTVTKNVVVS